MLLTSYGLINVCVGTIGAQKVHILYTYQITIFFFLYKRFYYNNSIHIRGIYLCEKNILFLYNTQKKSIILMCMEIFQHFCNVLVPYLQDCTFTFSLSYINIELCGILFQNLPK
jgi:hypothetical protein